LRKDLMPRYATPTGLVWPRSSAWIAVNMRQSSVVDAAVHRVVSMGSLITPDELERVVRHRLGSLWPIRVPFALLPWFLAAASIFPPSSMLGDACAALFVADITVVSVQLVRATHGLFSMNPLRGTQARQVNRLILGLMAGTPANPNRLDRVTTMVLGAGAVFLVVALVVTFLQTS
jgi:hypothetical protein